MASQLPTSSYSDVNIVVLAAVYAAASPDTMRVSGVSVSLVSQNTRLEVRSPDGLCRGVLLSDPATDPTGPLLVCIHGGGCNGRYFEVAKTSTAAAALALGFPVLLVDRPGYGGNPVPGGVHPIRDSVVTVGRFIREVLSKQTPGSAGTLIIGHSIGGAVTLMLAAEPRDLPILGVAVSGLGDVPRHTSADWPPLPAGQKSPLPETVSSEMFFGPVGTFGWDAVGRLRRASEPWVLAEIKEMVDVWPSWWRTHAARIATPVHFRLAEHEGIWRTGPEVVVRMAAALSGAMHVDAALLPDGGHIYELHKRGGELVEQQLRFLAEC